MNTNISHPPTQNNLDREQVSKTKRIIFLLVDFCNFVKKKLYCTILLMSVKNFVLKVQFVHCIFYKCMLDSLKCPKIPHFKS